MPSVPQSSFATSYFWFDRGDGSINNSYRQGGSPTVYSQPALSSTKIQVIGSAIELVGWNIINPNTSPVYVKLFNALSGDVTVGSTTPDMILLIPASGSIFFYDPCPCHAFTTGLTIACVTGLADSSNTAPTTAIYAELRYR